MMKIGMLWFDDDPKRSVNEKIERAAQRYHEKYGVAPDLCYANPQTTSDATFDVNVPVSAAKAGRSKKQVTLKTARTVLPNHFWIGVSES